MPRVHSLQHARLSGHTLAGLCRTHMHCTMRCVQQLTATSRHPHASNKPGRMQEAISIRIGLKLPACRAGGHLPCDGGPIWPARLMLKTGTSRCSYLHLHLTCSAREGSAAFSCHVDQTICTSHAALPVAGMRHASLGGPHSKTNSMATQLPSAARSPIPAWSGDGSACAVPA